MASRAAQHLPQAITRVKCLVTRLATSRVKCHVTPQATSLVKCHVVMWPQAT